jgi:hypothetical protein
MSLKVPGGLPPVLTQALLSIATVLAKIKFL